MSPNMRVRVEMASNERQLALRRNIKDGDERDRAREPLDAERKAIKRRLNGLPDPTPLAGACAAARAAMASAPVRKNGEPYFDGDDAEWFGFMAAEFLATHDGGGPC